MTKQLPERITRWASAVIVLALTAFIVTALLAGSVWLWIRVAA